MPRLVRKAVAVCAFYPGRCRSSRGEPVAVPVGGGCDPNDLAANGVRHSALDAWSTLMSTLDVADEEA